MCCFTNANKLKGNIYASNNMLLSSHEMDTLEVRVSNNKQLGRGVSLCQLRVLTVLLENYSMVEVTGLPHISL